MNWLLMTAEAGEEVVESTFDLAQHLTEQQGTMVFIIGCVVVLGFLGAAATWIYKNAKRSKKRK